MAKKKKQSGHYCQICGEYKANEKFSGKGHKQHICKTCMSASKDEKEFSLPIDEPLIDTEDILFPVFTNLEEIDSTPLFYKEKSFGKLCKEEKADLKVLTIDVINKYWEENRQIPYSNTLSEIRKHIIQSYKMEYEIQLRDTTELKSYIQNLVIVTINRLLKSEELQFA